MRVDRLIEHQAAFVEREHRPTPRIVLSLQLEAELLIEVDARGHARYRQHRYDAIHFHAAPAEPARFLPLSVDDSRRGRRTALTLPLFPPPQKNVSPPSDSSPDT